MRIRKKRRKVRMEFPDLEEIEMELERLNRKKSWRSALNSTIYTLIVVAAVIRTMVKDKKNGKHSCGGNCAACKGCHH